MRKTILVVDDEQEIRSFLARGFRRAGYAVHTAGNGSHALEKARRFDPDLIILDLMLPDIDGYSVCESLHKEPATANIPVIMLTGLPGELSRYAGIDAGAAELLHKPFAWPDLLASAQKALAHPRPAAAIPASVR